MKNIILAITCILFLAVNKLDAQIALGKWRDQQPYSHAEKVIEVENKIYCSTTGGLFSFNKEYGDFEKISKVTGLSDIGISTLVYNEENKILLIGYSNGNIDLIKNNQIYNIPDIKRKQITANKKINNVLFINQYAYLSCSFGIVVLDIDKYEIKDTYLIGETGNYIEINEIAFDGTFLYAASEFGIYKADINSSNLASFTNWNKLQDIPNYNKSYSAIKSFNNKLIANYNESTTNDIIYLYNGTNWSILDTSMHVKNNSIHIYNNKIIISSNYQVNIFDEQIINLNKIDWYLDAQVNSKDAIIGLDGIIWIADYNIGLVKFSEGWKFEKLHPSGPKNNEAVSMSVKGGNLWVTAGGVDASYGNLWKEFNMYNFSNEKWTNFDNSNLGNTNGVLDPYKVIVNPKNPNQLFVATWGTGIVEINNNKINSIYKDNNSSLQTIYETGSPYVRIAGICFDQNDNLWCTNQLVASPISVKKTDGSWKSFSLGGFINWPRIGEIISTIYNHKWVVLNSGGGVFILDDNGTIDNDADDKYKKISITDNNNNAISNEVYSIVEDKSGYIWIGTSQGAVVYYSPENFYTGEGFYAQRPIITLNGDTAYLLKNEIVTCIAVDGADRKWMGTLNSGVFLISPDGTEQILNFNESNSPLYSNSIVSIAIDDLTGEVYFGTNRGIISYRSDAIDGKNGYGNIYAYPNPVRETYDGPITITGLIEDSNVKITDISGHLVYETTSMGGQAIWNGKTFSGDRVHTGVYLIFCSDKNAQKTKVAKLLFIN